MKIRIKASGVNVWKPTLRKWSEAAVAMDDEGRVLFLFSRAPLTMKELLALPLGTARAMHVKGGGEALILSEDLNAGQIIDGVRVKNPFVEH